MNFSLPAVNDGQYKNNDRETSVSITEKHGEKCMLPRLKMLSDYFHEMWYLLLEKPMNPDISLLHVTDKEYMSIKIINR